MLLLEQSQQTRPGGRIDHTFVYQRAEMLGEARIRLRLMVAGDELTEIAPYVHLPESYERRFRELRSANDTIAGVAGLSAGLLYGLGGCILGVLWLARQHWLAVRPALAAGFVVGGLMAATAPVLGPKRLVRLRYLRNRRPPSGCGSSAPWRRSLSAAGSPMRSCSWRRKVSRGARSPISRNCGGCGRPRAARRARCSGRTLGGYGFVPIELALVAGLLLRDEPLARLVAAVRGADRSQHPLVRRSRR
jgi:hypothetical protein